MFKAFEFEKSKPLPFKISWIICGDNWSEMSGYGSKISSNSMWAWLTGREVGLVYLHTQVFLFCKNLQYKPIDRAIMLIAAIEVPVVKNILIFIGDQKLCGYVLSFVSVLFMLKIDTCFISRILLAKLYNPLSVRLEIFKDCIKLKLFILG